MRRIKNFLILSLISVFSFSFFGISPAKAASATLYLSPGSGTYVIGSNFNVGVKVNTDGEVVNAAEGAISFDNNLLEAVSVSKGGSIFPFWTTEPTPNNSAGTIRFGGGLPPPAYKGSAGHIITITFKAKKAGSASVRFSSGAVLANDGKGTNILASMGSANYTISPKSEAPKTSDDNKAEVKKEEPVEIYNKPVITSPSHPDQEKWYNKNVAQFKWDLPESIIGVSLALNDDSYTDPGPKSDGLFDQKEYSDISDGTHYFHLKFQDNKKWGTITNYKIMVDTEAPLPFEIKVKEVEAGEWPELSFETKDELSGLEKYEVIIGDKEEILKPDQNNYIVNGLEVGEYNVIVNAVDKAGNARIAKATVKINALDAPKITNYAHEIKSSDQFFVSGTALLETAVTVFIDREGMETITGTVTTDASGNWFYVYKNNLDNGRYIVWAVAKNNNEIESNPSEKVSFLVTPPIFAVIGDFVINYFTVFVSLLFLIVLIVILIIFLIWFAKKKLRRETVEIEEVLHANLEAYKKSLDQEFTALDKKQSLTAKKEAAKTKLKLKKELDSVEQKILKEVKDVEEMLK